MKSKQELKRYLSSEMERLDFAKKSIEAYQIWLVKLQEHYPRKDLKKLSFEEIKAFIEHHIKKGRASASGINIACHAVVLLYNRLWGHDYDFTGINRPQCKRLRIESLSQDEIIKLIDSTTNSKQKAVIALTYSSGLDLAEVTHLRLTDVDLIRDNLKIRDKNGKLKRVSILSNQAKNILNVHIEENEPSRYLFEGYKQGFKYSDRSVQRMFNQTAARAGIKRKLTFKVLKYSYIVHLEELGVPLRTTLHELGLKSSNTLDFFSEAIAKGNNKVSFSPLDKILHEPKLEYPVNLAHLEESIQLVNSKDEREYLQESLICIKSNSLRAGIIFAWNAAVVNIRKKCFSHGKVTLTQAIQKHYEKAPTISNLDDLANIKDSTLILAFQGLGHVDKGEKDALVECLNLRNKCGHPSQYRPKSFKAMSFLEELLTIVFNKQ